MKTINSKAWTGVPKKVSIEQAIAQAKQALQSKNFTVAEVIADKIRLKLPQHPQLLYIEAMQLLLSNQNSQAYTKFESAFAAGLKDASARLNAANIKRQQGELPKALSHIQAAIDIKPNYIPAWQMALETVHAMADQELLSSWEQSACHFGESDESLCSFVATYLHLNIQDKKALKTINNYLAKKKSEKLYLLKASISEMRGDYTTTNKSLAELSDEMLNTVEAKLLQAKLYKNEGEYQLAISILMPILKAPGNPQQLDRSIYRELHENYVHLKEYENAWQAAISMNSSIDCSNNCKLLETCKTDQIDIQNFSPTLSIDEGNSLKDVIYIIGFPRSGSTLIEKMLVDNYDVVTASESIAINQAEKTIYTETKSPWWKAPNISKALLNRSVENANKQYKREVESLNGLLNQFRIDKQLFNGFKLPFIKALTSNCLFIRVTRHPLDVVLSNYFANFMTTDTWHADLKTIAEYLVLCDQAIDLHVQKLQLPVQLIKYEDVVEQKQIPNELKQALNNHSIKATNVAPNNLITRTASYNQVNQPIHQGNVENYKRYLRFVDNEVMTILAPIIDKWGYKVDC